MGESAADKCDLSPCRTAEGFRFGALAMFLKEPETNTSLGPVCGQASGFTCVKNSDTMLYLTNDDLFRLFKMRFGGIHPTGTVCPVS